MSDGKKITKELELEFRDSSGYCFLNDSSSRSKSSLICENLGLARDLFGLKLIKPVSCELNNVPPRSLLLAEFMYSWKEIYALSLCEYFFDNE